MYDGVTDSKHASHPARHVIGESRQTQASSRYPSAPVQPFLQGHWWVTVLILQGVACKKGETRIKKRIARGESEC